MYRNYCRLCFLLIFILAFTTLYAQEQFGQQPNPGDNPQVQNVTTSSSTEEGTGEEIVHVPITMFKVNGQTYVTGGDFKENMTFRAANSPYVIVGDIIIPPQVTLSIEPGVVIKFGGDVIFPSTKPDLVLKILGTLKAVGTHDKPILFTTNEGTSSWGGILFGEQSTKDCMIQHCQIEGAKTFAQTGSVTMEDTQISREKLSHTVVEIPEVLTGTSKTSSSLSNAPKASATDEEGGCFGLSF